MSEVSHLATDKDIASMLLDLSNIISILLGGAIGFIAKYFLEFKKMKEDKKAIRQQMITNNIAPMRQAWINDTRNNITEYIHISLTLRVTLDAIFNSEPPIGYDEVKIKSNRSITLFEDLNKISRYLDILLPFSIEKNEQKNTKGRSEDLAEKVRACVLDIRNDFSSVFQDISNNDLENCHVLLNNILTSIDLLVENSKMLLLQEWRVTKSLKEIE
ncbi:TPA: hypothetical protein ACWL6U_003640 [Morganella morganii]